MSVFWCCGGGFCCCGIRFGLVDSVVKTCVPFLVEFQVSWTSDTSNSNSLPACNVLESVTGISNVSTEVVSTVGAFVGASESGGWSPAFCGYTVI